MKDQPASTTPCALGWHDSHNASAAALSRDGHILYAAAEERFTKRKLQKGTPVRVFNDFDQRFKLDGLLRCYTDLPLGTKIARNAGLAWNTFRNGLNSAKTLTSLAGTFASRLGSGNINGLVGTDDHKAEIDELCDHHTAHANSAYYLSGFDEAWVVTVDGVGDCLSGAVFEGRAGRLKRRAKFYYNDLTAAADYEVFAAMLGFDPDRHCGKITGLAAYGRHNDTCINALKQFLESSWRRGARNHFDHIHAPDAELALNDLRQVRKKFFGAFSREDLAYAIQHLTEQRVLALVRENVPAIAGCNIALAGGLFANVRINQKIKELGFARIFVAPPMDDGGLAVGAALQGLAKRYGIRPHRVEHMFWGPGFGEDKIREALDRGGVKYDRVDNLAYAVAKILSEGFVVGRFDGRMEFGPRAMGNRSILYDTRDPSVNAWLNKRLNRTEFMPFAPATMIDEAERCYEGLDGCEHAAEFMTITFRCTDYMRRTCPAVVHVDGTARTQLVTPSANPGLYDILDEYRTLTGIGSIVNTSFNMHESPIVLSPEDAVRTFQEGKLDYLAIGPFLAKAGDERSRRASSHRSTTESVARQATGQ